MSAETIPADVRELAAHYKEVWINEAKTLDHVITLAILTDRATRPAEPAAPVAEAGDGEVVAWRRRRKGCIGGESTWTMCPVKPERDREFDLEPLVRLSTLEAERARADELHWKRDFWENRGNKAFQRLAAAKTELAASGRCIDDLTARLAAAEQRAADALARAEKAEEALETAREDERDRLYGIALKDMEGRSMRAQHSHSAALWLRLEGAMDTYSRLAARSAATETATDGGEA